MSDDNSKIKLTAKPLTAKQKWNVFVTLLPWGLIVAFALLFSGMQLGNYQTTNSYNHDQAIKESAVKSVKQ